MGSRVKSFAIEATTTVRGIAKDLSQTPGIKAFCIALLTELDRVSQWLTESPSSPETTLQTFRLLDLLEKTLGWPSRPRSSSKSQASQQFDPKWFPSLENLRYNKGRFRNGLKDFASSPAAKQDRVKLHRFLKKFEGPHDDIQQPELSSLLQQAQMKEVQDDYQAYLRALYKTLALNCLCQQDDFHRRICVNLRLKNCDIDGKTLEGVRFGLFFLDHPHKHGSGGSCQWRDTQFCVVRKRAVGFHDVSKDMPSNQHGKTIADGEFCRIISDDPASKRVELSPRCAEILPSLGDSLSGTDVPPSSDRWFSQFQKLSTITHLRRGDRDASCKPVKIAILDTGLDPAYSSRGTVGFRDFVDERNRGFLDSSGHGTSAFQLMQKVHKDAQIFIGRVWESRQATSSTASLMTRAIRHARTDWEVDVIAIPSGFQSEHEEMLEAIEEASAAPRMYRAGKLFCMFSTDTNARSLPGFNPSPIQGAHNSFAILGENIVMEGKKEQPKESERPVEQPAMSKSSQSTGENCSAAPAVTYREQKISNRDILDERRLSAILNRSFGRGNYRVDMRHNCYIVRSPARSQWIDVARLLAKLSRDKS
ncbi:hypothetical protein Cob_v010829 [Colletotrichum orbiculare MAFF 240422]|uniref:Peptidase S8/S53 domain-containing protein n=1 Tax=Colletotrichum orbiculare (strain 104-T / ATCC 96160 / CBS 514.97 / LARS 414 / MAFF 240422) TaxID=1213857 RepID=A0A484FEI8_COLOR|nr:hypothetical protein Cob_v010829 [Colletotrichum orbiculare MAFF 240422]